ncbi:MAG: flagellar motor switch protein FliG [Candidatus Binatia bacterium]|nr:flagellar motor switch protein FliG [Candidatus Binatia bacterium]
MLTGPQKAALLLTLVGEEIASSLVSQLEEKELLLLRQGIHHTAYVEKEDVDSLLTEVQQHLEKASFLTEETAEYLRRVLAKALGPEKAAALMSRIVQEEDESSGIEELREMDSKTLANFLRDEHPQTVAFILAHLYPEHAGQILSLLSEEMQEEVAYRMAQLGRTSPEVIEEVSNLLRHEIRQVRGREVGGIRSVAEMLNHVDKTTEERILACLHKMDPELADSVRGLMFVFEDLVQIDDRSMQQLIREVEREKWVLALRTASPQLKKKIFGNMSERAGALLREELESLGPVRLRDVEKAQREILDFARQLEAEGKIFLTAGKGKEDQLV